MNVNPLEFNFPEDHSLLGNPPFSPTVDLDSQKKEKTNTSHMRLRSVFKMRTSILNTATTEQMGCISFFFFRLHEIYKLVFEMKIFGREYIFDGQNMYVLYVDSVWNNDENSLLIRGKSKLNSRTRKL